MRQRQIPALLVTHDPAEACFMAERIALLADGQLLQHDTPEQILRCPNSARAARLLGCLNVSETCYVPPEAVCLHNAPQGERCTVQQCFRQPLGWRVHLLHPRFGSLQTLTDAPPAGYECWASIDEERVVYFQAA